MQHVLKEKTADALWLKLEELCIVKSLMSKLHLKQRLYSHSMGECTSLEEHITTFKEIVTDLEILEVKYEEKDLGLILLCSLPISYVTYRDMILYSRNTLTLNEVYDTLFYKEKMKQLIIRPEAQGDSMFVCGRSQEKNYGEEQRKRSKSRNSNKICNYCKKKGHIKKGCFKLHNREKKFGQKQREKSGKSSEVSVVELDQIDEELLVVSDVDSRACENWILDYGSTLHKNRNRDWFSTYKLVHKGVVFMGNNASCKVAGIGTIHIKLFNME